MLKKKETQKKINPPSPYPCGHVKSAKKSKNKKTIKNQKNKHPPPPTLQ
jgi:hypothetical protein